MKNIIRYEIHYGGSLSSGMRNIAIDSMRSRLNDQKQIEKQNEILNLNRSKYITNEQSIVLILLKLLKYIRTYNTNLAFSKKIKTKREKALEEVKEENTKAQLNKYFKNLDKLIKGEQFNLIENTILIDQSQDINQIKKYFSPIEVLNLQESNCVGLSFIEVIFNSCLKIKKSNIDIHVLDNIYNLCVPFKDELLLFENYNSFNPAKEKFDIVKSFFAKRGTKLNEEEFDLL